MTHPCEPQIMADNDGDLSLDCFGHGKPLCLNLRVDVLDEPTTALIFAFHRAHPTAGLLSYATPLTQAMLDEFAHRVEDLQVERERHPAKIEVYTGHSSLPVVVLETGEHTVLRITGTPQTRERS